MNMRIICFVLFSAFALAATAQTPLPFGYTHAALMNWASSHKAEIKGGVEKYCHNVTPLGTHLPVHQCLTEADLAQAKNREGTSRR
jgi:hypothetical protein